MSILPSAAEMAAAIEDLTLCVGLAHRSIQALRDQIAELRGELHPGLDWEIDLEQLLAEG